MFEWNRFVKVIKWSLSNMRRNIILVAAALFAVFMIGDISRTMGNSVDFALYDDGAAWVATVLLGISLWIIFGGAWLFDNMKTKQGRITYLMLPASPLEKYLARYLIMTVGVLTVCLVAWIAADLVTMGLCVITFHETISFTKRLWIALFDIVRGYDSTVQMYFVTSICWLGHAFYVLGGTFFRRHQLIFSIITSWILFMLGLATGIWSLLSPDWSNIWEWEWTAKMWYSVAGTVLFCLVALFYWLSYVIFRRMQVINNKWTNW